VEEGSVGGSMFVWYFVISHRLSPLALNPSRPHPSPSHSRPHPLVRVYVCLVFRECLWARWFYFMFHSAKRALMVSFIFIFAAPLQFVDWCLIFIFIQQRGFAIFYCDLHCVVAGGGFAVFRLRPRPRSCGLIHT